MNRDVSPIPISWEPESGWVILIPSKLPSQTEAGIELPDSFTQKNNSGICVKISTAQCDEVYEHFLNQECFFPNNQEYRVKDSDTDQVYFVVRADHIIMSRKPPRKSQFVRILPEEKPNSKEEGKDAAAHIATLQTA